MAFGNLTHQTQPQTHATGMLGMTGHAIEGLEDALTLVMWHAWAPVVDRDLDETTGVAQLEQHIGPAIATGVFEQVAHGSAQQALIAFAGLQGRMGWMSTSAPTRKASSVTSPMRSTGARCRLARASSRLASSTSSTKVSSSRMSWFTSAFIWANRSGGNSSINEHSITDCP